MKTIEITLQEIWAETKPKIHKNKRKYNRKKITKINPNEINH